MDLTDEADYDRVRLGRRTFLRATALTAAFFPLWTSPAVAEPGPIVKPLPADRFIVRGTNAETRWEALAGTGNLVPIDRFFVRNHTLTPLLSAQTWRLRLFGTGLRGAPTAGNPVELGYQDLLDLPARTVTARIECAGNGRSFYTTQQNQSVTGTAWQLGAVGVARWRGVPLSTVLERAGLRRSAVDVLPAGLDPDYVTGGVNLGPVRRPLPIRKALKDVLVAYEMNGEPLPPDHGFPVRLVVPDWIGIASIKWLGGIEVSDTPLVSPWNTQFYRLVGPDYPPEGELIGRQNIKSAFELPWGGTLAAGRTHHLTGRSWSGTGGVRGVEVSTDGRTWRHAAPRGHDGAWLRWSLPWRPTGPGSYTLRARATDRTGAGQPAVAPYNTQGYLFGAVVGHPITVA
ncbi:sulfite oxidase [Actinophytocola sp.]|uniref:sulfite oxidase n=1 Tax=Actinophytocola sp. TaxID=1872138 RepID=UPI002D52C10F|nr:sulfite oxidase [Actinophytocola sp.]HYQ69404.1 sulfite oxidase [Actinophytocola sp.]